MYIIKLKNANDIPSIQSTRSASLQKQRTSHKAEYSDSFQKLMSKVLNRIYCQNNFTNKRKNHFLNFSFNQKGQNKFFDKKYKHFSPRRCSTTFQEVSIYNTNKTSYSNISKEQSQKNKSIDPKNKSSFSFINNRQFLKGIKLKKQQNKYFQQDKLRKCNLMPTQTTYFQSRYSMRSKKKIQAQNFVSDRCSYNNVGTNKYGLGIQKIESMKSNHVVSKIKAQRQTKKQQYFSKNLFKKKQIEFNIEQQDNLTFEPWNSDELDFDQPKIFFKQERRA